MTITEQDIEDQIKIIDSHKAYGPDGISPKLLKEGGSGIIKSLTLLFNCCIKQQKMPSLWKKADVLPLFKKDDPANIENYRPISLLSCVSKVFEKVVFKYMYNFLQDNFVLSQFQSGFLPGLSTNTQLLEAYHKFCEALDKNKEIRVVFLDISKAFDRIWHKGLIFKLHECGIRGRMLNWFIDYLKGRQQRVIINGTSSPWGYVQAGVPQGSVLGPLLFLIYINDLTSAIKNCNIRLFADDTCLFLEVDDREEAANKINSDLESMSNWSNQWLVNFSASKTKSLIISNKRNHHLNPTLFLNGTAIEEVKYYKYLGLHLSFNLRWNVHIDKVYTKSLKMLNMMLPLKFKINRKSLEIIYKAFVLPMMEYGNVVWGSTYDSDINKLERIQVEAMRLITGATAKSSIAALYKDTTFLTIATRCEISQLVMFFKIQNGLAPFYLCDLLPLDVNNTAGGRYELRNRNNITVPNQRLTSFSRSFFPSVIRLWNDLPLSLRHLPTLIKFKKELLIKYEKAKSNPLYYYGERWSNVHHARLRLGCSKLAYDLTFNLHVQENPYCVCGALENSFHYFFVCPSYTNIRQNLINALPEKAKFNLATLLFGDPELTFTENIRVFSAVHKFISDSLRFT